MRTLSAIAGLMGVFLAAFPVRAQSPGLPSVGVELDGAGKVRLSWPQSAVGYTMEETDSLPGSPWLPVAEAPVAEGNRFVVTVSPTASSRFYRLRSGPRSALTTIRETSPTETDEDVPVNRETMIYFSGPLAADATIDDAHFYANAGGRRLCFQREPADAERAHAAEFLAAYRAELNDLPEGERDLAVWSAYARALLASNELLYVD